MIEYTTLSGFKYYKPTTQATEAIKKFYKGKIYIYDNLLISSATDVFEKMQYMYRKRGTKVFVLDNWMCLNVEAKSDDERTAKQTEFMAKLIHFCKKNNVQVHLVCHPKKPAAGMPMDEYSLLGTSNITNLSDRIFAVEKAIDKDLIAEGFDRQLSIFKDRTIGNKGQHIGLYYDRVTRRLRSKGDDMYKKYAWDDGSIRYSTQRFGESGLLVAHRKLDIDEKESPF